MTIYRPVCPLMLRVKSFRCAFISVFFTGFVSPRARPGSNINFAGTRARASIKSTACRTKLGKCSHRKPWHVLASSPDAGRRGNKNLGPANFELPSGVASAFTAGTHSRYNVHKSRLDQQVPLTLLPYPEQRVLS